MAKSQFQPGFRISAVDGIVIVAGTIAAVSLWPTAWSLGFVVAFVIAHFFAFCNLFRVARPLELAWSGIFIVLTYCTIRFGMPWWSVTIGCSLLATVAVIAIEIRKPSYHGIFWERLNPGLPKWWAAQGEIRT